MKQLILYIERTSAILSTLTPEQAGLLFKRLLAYTSGNDMPTGEPMADAMFEVLKVDIDASFEKYDDICEKRREAGKKGGAPKGNQNARKNNQNEQKVDLIEKNNQNNQNEQNNQNNQNISISKSISINNNIINPNGLKLSSTDNPKQPEPLKLEKLVIYWNGQLKAHESILSEIKSINGTRKNSVLAREKEYGREALKTVIDKAAASEFLNGKNNRGWIASFDWVFMHPQNFQKVLEGNYDNKNISITATTGSAETASARVDRLLGLPDND